MKAKKEVVTKKERKVRRINPYTPKWEKLANELARSYQDIKACKHCGYPVLSGYCCPTCKSNEP